MYYNHLSRKERYQIFVLLQAGKNKKEIAQLLNRHPSTISREIKRNSKPNQTYQAHEAVTLARKRRKGKAYRHCKAPNIKEGDRRYKRPIKQRPRKRHKFKSPVSFYSKELRRIALHSGI
ncbi:helix-turn-helix domain-containing protein [Gilliamella sp. Pas-s27]|uniref:helix-turn-helix domain-containing protein n=1 Tax=Gilliamella sp. Pas-s27 TaxID=2687311 RepID=UPI00136655F7|nr:helix-turn-helix domain-containing protein [Gilliamella sp. Pas-s27]